MPSFEVYEIVWLSPARFNLRFQIESAIRTANKGRLHNLMDSLHAEQSVLWISKDQSLKMDCSRNLEAASCVIRMLPSEFVQIENRLVQVQMPFDELAIDHADLKGAPELALRFLNSNGDHLQLRILHNGLEIKAGKRSSKVENMSRKLHSEL